MGALDPWLTIGGVLVPIAEGRSGTRRRTIEIGQRRRAINGAMRSSVFTRKKEWEFTTPPIDTGLRDRILEQLESASLPLTCVGTALGESGYADVTFTRTGSIGRYTDVDGFLKNAAADTERREWLDLDGDGTFQTESLLLEAARTNELVQSEDLDTTWTKTNLDSIATDQRAGPDGVVSLDEIIEDGTTNPHGVTQAVTGMTADADYALSAWAVANTRSWLRLVFFETAASANHVRAFFDLAAGAVGTADAGGTATLREAYVEDWSHIYPGLYRCVVSGSVGNSATAISAALRLATGDTVESYEGDGSSLFAGYAQLEDDAAEASSYIPTTTIAATRNADTWFATAPVPQAFTLYGKLRVRTSPVTLGRLAQIGSATSTADPRFGVVRFSTTQYQAFYDNGIDAAVVSNVAVSPEPLDALEYRALLFDDGSVQLAVSVNEGAESVGPQSSAPSAGLTSPWAAARLYLNSGGSSQRWLANYIATKMESGSRSMDAMRSLSAPNLFPALTLGEVSCYAEVRDATPLTIRGRPMWVLDFTLFEN